MAPFNNTYSSSVFASLDNVAIESVAYNFLRSEFTIARCASLPSNVYTQGTDTHGRFAFPQMRGADDYLHQAADSSNWPAGIKYDPDSTGVHIKSLGVDEHWNNATDKKYTRNLGNGTGIELLSVEPATITSVASRESGPESFQIYQNYPNPFNPSTTIAYSLPEKASVTIMVYDLLGREIKSLSLNAQSAGYQRVVWNGTNNQGSTVSSGVYLYRVRATSLNGGKTFDRSAKMMMLK